MANILNILKVVLFFEIVQNSLERQTFEGWSHRNSIKDPESNFKTEDFIRYLGYPVENHTVTTEDGYILQMYRIPYGKNAFDESSTVDPRPPVYLQHCLLCSSDDWVFNLENESLSYMLADAGFDVWIGNIRGNKYSMGHTDPVPSHHDFFQFSWDDMAEYDIPALIDYILEATGYEDLQYIGHSMGTTMGFALLSTKLEYNAKVRHMHALAPVATLRHVETPLKYLVPFLDEIEILMDLVGYDDFLPSDELMKLLSEGCGGIIKSLCADVIFLICGYDVAELNVTRLPIYISHTPAGTSSMTVIHYAQEISSGNFQRYDYGKKGNIKKYGQNTPPLYDVRQITTPVSLYWGQNDLLADPTDVDELRYALGNCVESRQTGGPDMSHLDFVWGVDDAVILNNYLISKLEKY